METIVLALERGEHEVEEQRRIPSDRPRCVLALLELELVRGGQDPQSFVRSRGHCLPRRADPQTSCRRERRVRRPRDSSSRRPRRRDRRARRGSARRSRARGRRETAGLAPGCRRAVRRFAEGRRPERSSSRPSRSRTSPNSGFPCRWYSDTSGGVRTTTSTRSRVETERVEHSGVGLEARERVLLLQARIAAYLASGRARGGRVAPAGSRRGRSRGEPHGSRGRAGRARTRSRKRRTTGSRANARRGGARATRATARGRSRDASRSGATRGGGPPSPAPCRRRPPHHGRARRPRARSRAARGARSSARTPWSSPEPRARGPGAARRADGRTAPAASWRCRSRRARA